MTGTKILTLPVASALLLVFVLSFVLTVSQGKTIFMREGCSNCHSFKGHGGAIAPDLTSVSQRRSMIWIMTQIRNPRAHNPDARMPGYAHLSIREQYAIAHFLKD